MPLNANPGDKFVNLDDQIRYIWKAGEGWKEISKDSWRSIERLNRYLFKVTYDELPEPDFTDDGAVFGACSSYISGGKLYRNLDWNYDESPEYIVVTDRFTGMAFGTDLDALPYRVNDGVNEDGIMVTCHVLFDDWEFTGSGRKDIPMTRIPFLILNELHSIDDIDEVQDYLDNLASIAGADYILHFMVSDGTTTYYIGPSNNGYTIKDATSNPKLANFNWVSRDTVSRSDSDLQKRPTGLERFNAMPCDLEDIHYTLIYESPDFLSDFIGIDGTTKDSTDEELTEIYEKAHALYLERKRDGKTWQTMHSAIYSPNGLESLYIQENYKQDYISALPIVTNEDNGKVLMVVDGKWGAAIL